MKREGSKYNDKKFHTVFSSATSIRENIKNNYNLNLLESYMPSPSLDVLINFYF